MRIAVDAMGGDRAPEEVVKGALSAARELGIGVILVGDENAIKPFLPAKLPANVEVQHASQVVEMGEAPTSVRRKKDSSIAVATRLHKEGRADAVLSAGNTGAAAASALFTLERIPGVDRPGIATVFPTVKRPLVLLDAGANVDCRPRHLVEFALMGAVYSRCVLGIVSDIAGDFFSVSEADKLADKSTPQANLPSVGLLSIGEEATKGNDLTKNSFKLLEAAAQAGKYTFYGNVEGRDISLGTTDVVVCDGFVGNVVLKVSEGLAKMIGGELKRSFTSGLRAKIGALILKPALQKFKKRLDYTEFGGAALLGVNGVCIICHGSSDERSIFSAIRIAKQIVETDVVGSIKSAMAAAAEIEAATLAEIAATELQQRDAVTSLPDSLVVAEIPTVTTDSGEPVVPPVNF